MQETYLRAWRAYHGFENRSSLRTWMYTIATNTCLTALQSKHRRLLPSGIGAPSGGPSGTLETRPEVPWLEPLPDAVVWGRDAEDPAEEIVTRESVRLAFVAALQHLTPQQRAVLILRDVLAWHASEVAPRWRRPWPRSTAVCSGPGPTWPRWISAIPRRRPTSRRRAARRLHGRLRGYDVDRIVSLLTDDAIWEMPPFLGLVPGPRGHPCPRVRRTVRPRARGTSGWSVRRRTGNPPSPSTCAGRTACTGPFSCSSCTFATAPWPSDLLLRHQPVRDLRAAQPAVGRAIVGRQVGWRGE